MSSSLALLLLSTIARSADYTGDGIDDLVVGAPNEDIGGFNYAGGIHVIRGSTTGLSAVGDAFLHQDTAGVVGRLSHREYFGFALGAGDVDGDGTDEVIVAAPNEDSGGFTHGAIWVLELAASATATTVHSSQTFTQATAGGTSEGHDRFGQSIAVADFDGDGYDDVAVGLPHQEPGGVDAAGSVMCLRGGSTGLTASADWQYNQDSADVADSAEAGDEFGSVLAAGDFDADGYADLAIGNLQEDRAGTDEGIVHVLYGTATGPGAVDPDDQLWTAGEGLAAGIIESFNFCGAALAVGDFDGDGYDDLAIGCPGYDLGSRGDAGTVLLVYGSSAGLDESELWNQEVGSVLEDPTDAERFGSAVTAGDFDGDGFDDLAVSAPEENIDFTDDGVVHVLFGSASGVTDVGNFLLAQDIGTLVHGTPADRDYFGYALTSGDYNGDGLDDLVVGTPYDYDSGAEYGGVVNVFPGSASGPSTTRDRWFHQDLPGMENAVGLNDRFGAALR